MDTRQRRKKNKRTAGDADLDDLSEMTAAPKKSKIKAFTGEPQQMRRFNAAKIWFVVWYNRRRTGSDQSVDEEVHSDQEVEDALNWFSEELETKWTVEKVSKLWQELKQKVVTRRGLLVKREKFDSWDDEKVNEMLEANEGNCPGLYRPIEVKSPKTNHSQQS